MIDKEYDTFVLVCDNCGEKFDNGYEFFEDAVEGKKDIGFISKKYANGWMDLCPECQG